MPTWLTVILFLGGAYALVTGWEHLRDNSKTAASIGEATGTVVDGVRWIAMKGIGVLAGAGAIFSFTAGPDGFKGFAFGVIVLLYAAYLLFPGRPDDKTLWPW